MCNNIEKGKKYMNNCSFTYTELLLRQVSDLRKKEINLSMNNAYLL